MTTARWTRRGDFFRVDGWAGVDEWSGDGFQDAHLLLDALCAVPLTVVGPFHSTHGTTVAARALGGSRFGSGLEDGHDLVSCE